MEAHLPEELVFLQHHHGDGVRLLQVKEKLHSGRRVSQKVSFVLSSKEDEAFLALIYIILINK